MKKNVSFASNNARPMSDMLKSVPPGAHVIAAAGSRSQNRTTIHIVCAYNNQTLHFTCIREGGRP